jgi:hypothetical protein
MASIIRITSAATITWGSVGTATTGRGWGSLGSHVDETFQRATSVQGVVVALVNGAFEKCHDLGALLAIHVRLADPSKVRGVNITARGRGDARSNVGMGITVQESVEECIPDVEAVYYINDTGGDLTKEIQELGGEPVDHQQAEEGILDGLAKEANFCGKATNMRAVMCHRFYREHASLKEASEDGHLTSNG